MTDLLQLAERCEQAAGPDRKIDEAILKAAWQCRGRTDLGPKFTASLDAAMTLVPEGHCGQVQFGKHPGAWVAPVDDETPADFNAAATPALALCAAALRARSA